VGGGHPVEHQHVAVLQPRRRLRAQFTPPPQRALH
jgi:hypothetical protein